MHVRVSPDPVLRQMCEVVERSEIRKLRKTAREMAKIMYQCNGVGLAAPQVGVQKRLIVVDCAIPEEDEEIVQDPLFLVNPVILYTRGDEIISDEGCLSIPGVSISVKRFPELLVEALDLDGEVFSVEADGLLARALQHEIDHLDGITLFEHLDPIARIDALKVYEEAIRAGAKPGETSASLAEKRESAHP